MSMGFLADNQGVVMMPSSLLAIVPSCHTSPLLDVRLLDVRLLDMRLLDVRLLGLSMRHWFTQLGIPSTTAVCYEFMLSVDRK